MAENDARDIFLYLPVARYVYNEANRRLPSITLAIRYPATTID
jgi:hypothetical protein